MDRCSTARPGAADCRGASMNDIIDLTDLTAGVAESLSNGTLTDPFAVLGPHNGPAGRIVRTFLPGAAQVEVVARVGGRSLGQLAPVVPPGLFVGHVDSAEPYALRIRWPGVVQETEDPYSF